ncbi:5091_t:CDS:2, partial [Acaulospora morrowiae]
PPVSSNDGNGTNDSPKPLAGQTKVEPNLVVRPPKQQISFEKNIQLPQLPSLFETIGYAHFFGSFLIGPQFSFHLYRKFLTVSLYPDASNVPPGSYKSALKSLTLGALYLGVHQIAVGYFPTSYLITPEYAAKPFIKRLAIMWCAGKFSFTKYLGIWTLAEGACILSGISFNGYDDNGKVEWNGLANVEKWKFEFATSLAQIIGSFNTNTNLWTKTYIFKRLIFLGNKNLST